MGKQYRVRHGRRVASVVDAPSSGGPRGALPALRLHHDGDLRLLSELPARALPLRRSRLVPRARPCGGTDDVDSGVSHHRRPPRMVDLTTCAPPPVTLRRRARARFGAAAASAVPLERRGTGAETGLGARMFYRLIPGTGSGCCDRCTGRRVWSASGVRRDRAYATEFDRRQSKFVWAFATRE